MRSSNNARGALLLVLALWSTVGCGSDKPTQSDASSVDVSGLWTGVGSDNTGPGTLSFSLTQSGSRVTGTFGAHDFSDNFVEGTVAGSVSGNEFDGELSASYRSCQISIQFMAGVEDTLMGGEYDGVNSCTGPVTDGWFILTRELNDRGFF